MIRLLTYLLAVWPTLAGRLGANSGYQPPSQPPPGNQGHNQGGGGSSASNASTLAMVTLGLGIASWTVLPGIAAWGGVVTGWIERDKINKGQSPADGKTINEIGFWMSVANVALQLVAGCLGVAVPLLCFGGYAAFLAFLGVSGA